MADDERSQVEDLYSLVYGVMAEDEMRRDDFLDALARFMEQAEAQYAEWPLVA